LSLTSKVQQQTSFVGRVVVVLVGVVSVVAVVVVVVVDVVVVTGGWGTFLQTHVPLGRQTDARPCAQGSS
jgi:hypothetical protein